MLNEFTNGDHNDHLAAPRFRWLKHLTQVLTQNEIKDG